MKIERKRAVQCNINNKYKFTLEQNGSVTFQLKGRDIPATDIVNIMVDMANKIHEDSERIKKLENENRELKGKYENLQYELNQGENDMLYRPYF